MKRQGLKIGIIGAGPAGLYFALLMKKANPQHSITIVEQNPAGATYGWGVVFSGRALSFLRDSDSASYVDIEREMLVWDDQSIIQQGERVQIDGSRYSGLARLTLLNILQKHCTERGIAIRFEERVPDLAEFADYDLVVGADGSNSVVRQQFAEQFGTETSFLSNKYIWYGTHQPFDTLSLIFREFKGGAFVAHSYSFSPQASTFIVECDAASWQRAGFENMDDEQSRRYCEAIFTEDLKGHDLLLNKSVWLNFKVVTNRNWTYRNVVLLGDALRTVHFSIGSGTRMALEDAIALFQAFQQSDEVDEALRLFEQTHRPNVEKMLEVARNSFLWYETFHEKMHLPAIPFAYDYMMRGGRIDFEILKRRAPRFAAHYETWRRQTALR